MYICPLCNQLQQQEQDCPRCERMMEDRGRMMDYFDDYSAYLDIEGMKTINGIANDSSQHQCPHVFYCPNCTYQKILVVHEIEMQ